LLEKYKREQEKVRKKNCLPFSKCLVVKVRGCEKKTFALQGDAV